MVSERFRLFEYLVSCIRSTYSHQGGPAAVMLWGLLKWLGTLSPTMIWICRLALISRPMGLGLHLQVDLIVLDHAGARDQIQQPASLHLQVAEGFACSHIGICLP